MKIHKFIKAFNRAAQSPNMADNYKITTLLNCDHVMNEIALTQKNFIIDSY